MLIVELNSGYPLYNRAYSSLIILYNYYTEFIFSTYVFCFFHKTTQSDFVSGKIILKFQSIDFACS